MICDGIENCVQYIGNFDPSKSSNPFAYFTQIIYYAFLRRISKEKRQLEIKNKIITKSGYDQLFHSDGNDDLSDEQHQRKRTGKIKLNIAIITDQHFGARKSSRHFHDYLKISMTTSSFHTLKRIILKYF